MSSAAFAIIWMNIAVEWNAVIWCSFGGAIGTIFGFHYVDYLLNGASYIFMKLISFIV